MISLLPVVVQISVVLFLVGLLLLLDSINSTVATVFAVIGGSTLGLFVVMVSLPVIVASCPFKTPIVPTILAFGQFCAIPLAASVIFATWLVGGIVVAIGVSAWNIKWVLTGLLERMSKRPPPRKTPAKRPGLAPLYNTFGDAFLLRCVHAASAVFQRWFWTTGEFWLSRELGVINDVDVDMEALSDAPVVVPKGQLDALLPCVDELAAENRLHVATNWSRLLLNLSCNAGLLLNSSLHAMSYTGPLRYASRSTFLELRPMLWSILPTAWSREYGEDHNRMLSMMLCLLFRGLPEEVETEELGFLAEYGKRVFDIRNSQNVEDVAPAGSTSSNASVIPTSLLFHCYERGLRLDRERRSS